MKCPPLKISKDKDKRANLKTSVLRKQRAPKFPKNEHFLLPYTDTNVCISGCKRCSFFGKFGLLCFFETTVFRFALLLYYRLPKSQVLRFSAILVY